MPMRPSGESPHALADLVGELDECALRELVLDAAGRHDDVARSVRLAAAPSNERLALLRVDVDRGLRTRRFLDYWQSSEWAQEAAMVVDALTVEVEREPSAELAVLLERGVGHLVKVILRADDSNGSIGDLAHRVLELHEQVCAAQVAEPRALAKWMVRFTFDDQDFFVVDPVRYARALGDEGMAQYRKEVAKRSDTTERVFAATYAAERLAVLDRDVEGLIQMLGGDLLNPHQYLRVAEAMVELGLDDEALEWARRGIAETAGWQVAKLYDLATRLEAQRGDLDAVLSLRRNQFQQMPSAPTYALFRTAAQAGSTWTGDREKARARLAEKDPGGLVDVLLEDQEPDEAWRIVTAQPDWELGPQRWERLARAREASDPADALAVYLQLADLSLVETGKRAYQTALRHLRAARRAAKASAREAAFAEHVEHLREQHRRRPTFITMLDKATLT